MRKRTEAEDIQRRIDKIIAELYDVIEKPRNQFERDYLRGIAIQLRDAEFKVRYWIRSEQEVKKGGEG